MYFDDFPKIGGLVVSNQIMQDGKKPMFIYRECEVVPEDSGWRIFSGEESDEYIDDSENFKIYNPSTILKIEPSIERLLLSPIGSVFERNNELSEWYIVTDFELDRA